jgi:CBS domain-containing protein
VICPNCGFDNLPGSDECASCLQDLTHIDRPAPMERVEKGLMEDPVAVLRPTPAVSVKPSASVAEAVKAMIDHNVGALLVIDEPGELVGIFTERDVLMKVVGDQPDLRAVRVADVMTPKPETVTLTDKLDFALCKMATGDYRHLPVLDQGRATGVISIRDFLRYVRKRVKE